MKRKGKSSVNRIDIVDSTGEMKWYIEPQELVPGDTLIKIIDGDERIGVYTGLRTPKIISEGINCGVGVAMPDGRYYAIWGNTYNACGPLFNLRLDPNVSISHYGSLAERYQALEFADDIKKLAGLDIDLS
jgi:hypothetical protein